VFGTVPFSADTVINTMYNTKIRKQWDTYVDAFDYIDKDNNIIYWDVNWPIPFVYNRDYVLALEARVFHSVFLNYTKGHIYRSRLGCHRSITYR